MYKLKYSSFYRDGLKSAIKYIRQDLKNPIAAKRLKDEVKETYKKIKGNPFMYPAVPDEYLASMGFRFTMVKKYMLFYTVEENEIIVVRFLYGSRDWMNILRETNNEVYEKIDPKEFEPYINVGLEPTRKLTKNDSW